MLNILTIRPPRVSRAFFFLDWKTRYKIHETKGWVFFKIKKKSSAVLEEVKTILSKTNNNLDLQHVDIDHQHDKVLFVQCKKKGR